MDLALCGRGCGCGSIKCFSGSANALHLLHGLAFAVGIELLPHGLQADLDVVIAWQVGRQRSLLSGPPSVGGVAVQQTPTEGTQRVMMVGMGIYVQIEIFAQHTGCTRCGRGRIELVVPIHTAHIHGTRRFRKITVRGRVQSWDHLQPVGHRVRWRCGPGIRVRTMWRLSLRLLTAKVARMLRWRWRCSVRRQQSPFTGAARVIWGVLRTKTTRTGTGFRRGLQAAGIHGVAQVQIELRQWREHLVLLLTVTKEAGMMTWIPARSGAIAGLRLVVASPRRRRRQLEWHKVILQRMLLLLLLSASLLLNGSQWRQLLGVVPVSAAQIVRWTFRGVGWIHSAQVAEVGGIGSTATTGEQKLLMMRLQLLGGTGKYPGDPRGSVKLLLLTQTATNRIYVQWSTSIRIAIQIIAAGVGTQNILVAGTRHCLVEVGLRIGRHCRLLGPDLQQTLKKAPGRVRRRLETQLTGGGHQGTSPWSTSGDEVPSRQKSTIIAGGFLRYIAVPPLEETTVHHIHVAGLQRLLRVSQFRDALHIQHKASI